MYTPGVNVFLSNLTEKNKEVPRGTMDPNIVNVKLYSERMAKWVDYYSKIFKEKSEKNLVYSQNKVVTEYLKNFQLCFYHGIST